MPRKSILAPLQALGPGLVVAAAGIGAGDVITATVTGAEFGTRLAWALLACVALKFMLNEGVARWQLATGSTIIEACARRLPRWVSGYFFAYLLFWTFFVGGSLTNACGLAGHSLFPQLPVWAWGIIHSAVAATLVLVGRFALFEQLMKALVGVMVLTVLICAVLVKPHVGELLKNLAWPTLPANSGKSVLGIFGGIGGSMTMLCYGYWIRENAWSSATHQRAVRADLLLAYAVTLIFAIALTIVAAGCNAAVTQGSGMAVEVATRSSGALGISHRLLVRRVHRDARRMAGRALSVRGFHGAPLARDTGRGRGFENHARLSRLPALPRRTAAGAALRAEAGGDGDPLHGHQRVLHALPRGAAALSQQPRRLDRQPAQRRRAQRRARCGVAAFRLDCGQ
jgi:hypothetical protein